VTDLEAELEAFERIEAFRVNLEAVFGPVKLRVQRLGPDDADFDAMDARLAREKRDQDHADREARRRAYYRDRNRQTE
jgi:hypothetical protein